VTKGAPQVILELSANAAAVKAAVDKAVNDFAARGFRALGVARADGDGKWQLLGVLPLFDPPRDDAKSTVATARQMGVKIKMVTGDAWRSPRRPPRRWGWAPTFSTAPASAIPRARKPRRHQVHRGCRRFRPGISRAQIPHRRCPAEARPHRRHDRRRRERRPGAEEGRLRHRRFRRHRRGARGGLHRAGDPGLSVIIDAIKESRKIFQRMNSYAIYRIAETLRVLLFMTLAILSSTSIR
jgi:H+-transporting ATPase